MVAVVPNSLLDFYTQQNLLEVFSPWSISKLERHTISIQDMRIIVWFAMNWLLKLVETQGLFHAWVILKGNLCFIHWFHRLKISC